VRALVSLAALALVTGCGPSAPGQAVDAPENISSETIAPEQSAVPETAPVIQDEPISAGDLSGQYKDAGPGRAVVMIVPGSGPTDLNGNSPMGITAGTYQKLAEELAAKNISTVRVDKRGMFSSKAAGDPNKVTLEIYAEDYRSWAKAIRSETSQTCVYMLGHSEGAMMVSAAAIDNPDVCGLILVSGMGRPYGDVIREQLKANPANIVILGSLNKTLESLERGEAVASDDINPLLRPMFPAEIQGFLVSVMGADPADLARKAKARTLIIHGETDLQTKVLDARNLAKPR